ncbi:hypothetical protein AVEN_162528-1 [Araneus ventricosus]|uniref:Uncharacterized protein n=1 Tax=Araneus ventricosus TaxID=182803 RepID=A0A4Y2I6J3_ARAVE|nr:hypothetical protein AVEN_162528-1 [Araneus ventricosus]
MKNEAGIISSDRLTVYTTTKSARRECFTCIGCGDLLKSRRKQPECCCDVRSIFNDPERGRSRTKPRFFLSSRVPLFNCFWVGRKSSCGGRWGHSYTWESTADTKAIDGNFGNRRSLLDLSDSSLFLFPVLSRDPSKEWRA